MAGFNEVAGQNLSVIADLRGPRVADTGMGVGIAAQTVALDEGVYEVWSTADCYMLAETGAAGTTAINGLLLRANTSARVRMINQSKIGLFCTAGGTFSCFKVA